MKSNNQSKEKILNKSQEKIGKNRKKLLSKIIKISKSSSNLNPEKIILKNSKNFYKNEKTEENNDLKDNIDIIKQLKEAKELEDLEKIYSKWDEKHSFLSSKNKMLKIIKDKKEINREEKEKVNNNEKKVKEINNKNSKSLETAKILKKIKELRRRKLREKENENKKDYTEEEINKLKKNMKKELSSILQRKYLLSEKENNEKKETKGNKENEIYDKQEDFTEKLEYIIEVGKYLRNEIIVRKDDNLILQEDAEKNDNIIIKFLGYIGSELSFKNINTYIEIEPTNEAIRDITFKILLSGLATQQVYKIILDNEDYQIIFFQDIEKWFSYLENIKSRISNIYNISSDNIYFFNHNLNTFEVNLVIYNTNLNKLENILKNYYLKSTKTLLLTDIILSTNFFNIEFCKNENDWPKENLIRGGKKYYPPYGCIGIALKLDDKYDKNNDIWLGKENKEGEWPVAYHGIGKGNVFQKVLSIMNNNLQKGSGQFYKDFKNVEKNQKQYNNCGEGVYLTPNIKVALEYAEKINLGLNNLQFKFVIMTRVNPNKIRSPGTLKGGWILNGNNEEIRPYRILIKTF